MAVVIKKFDLCVSETYKSREGEEKKVFHKVGEGVMFEGGGIRIKRYDGNVEYCLFERKQDQEKNETIPF